ncbi:MAG: hypothetical protein K2L02_00345 [Clostridia bacterium]|nr:hypothetical protein [Clostridia bacterium]
MKDTFVLDEKRKASFKRTRVFCAVLTYAFAILALACLIGIVVSVLMLNFGARSERKDLILYILSGSFAGGAGLFALSTYLFSKLTSAVSQKELDFRERLDSEESFFVGEGTLLTFGEKGVTLHGEEEGKYESVFVPYGETRYISICTRRRAREKGTWCVAIEMPVKYLMKKGEKAENEKVLVQADAKDRLYETLKKHGLTVLGEKRDEQKENQKFKAIKKFSLPNGKKRKTAILTLVVGILLAGGSVPLGIYYSASVGALMGAAGLVFLFRGTWNFIRAKAVFGVYGEGIFWRESNGKESLFLKWEDIESVIREEKNGYPVLTFKCSYGRYAIPAVRGAYECIKELKEEKCTQEK